MMDRCNNLASALDERLVFGNDGQSIQHLSSSLRTPSWLNPHSRSLIATGILALGQSDGLADWRRVFIIEGSLTMSVFLIFILFSPRTPGHSKPIYGRWDM